VFCAIIGPVMKDIGLGDRNVRMGRSFVGLLEMLVKTIVADQPVSDTLTIPAGPFEEAAGQEPGPTVEPVTRAEVRCMIGRKQGVAHLRGIMRIKTKYAHQK